MNKKNAIKIIEKLLKELPHEIAREDALHTYYNNYEVEDLLFIVLDVLNGKGYDCGDYAI